MNLFLFCLPLAVPSTFRPKGPPERGLKEVAFKTFGLLLLEKLATTGSAPDTRCSLLDLCGVWSGQAQSQTTARDARRATAIWRQLHGVRGQQRRVKRTRLIFRNMFESMKGGARERFVHPRASCGIYAFLVLT